jgi:hypothetical protein
MCIHHYITYLAKKTKKTKRLYLLGSSYSGRRFGYLGASPKGPGPTTWCMDLTMSRHFTEHTTDAERVSTGGSGKMIGSLLSSEATTLLTLPNMK